MRAALLAGLVLACLAPLSANWGGSAGGSLGTGTFRPSGTDQVEMLQENLVIRLFRDRALVTVEYVLRNSGEAVDVKAGFPCLAILGEDSPAVEDYRLTVDGLDTPYKLETGDARPYQAMIDEEFLRSPAVMSSEGPCRLSWLTSTVAFLAGQTRYLRISYESPYQYSYGGPSGIDSHHEDSYFRYLLSTGAAWKGPIRNGKVTLKGETVSLQSLRIRPERRFRPTAEGLVWVFTDLEPTLADDIQVCLNDRYSTIAYRGQDGSRMSKSWYTFDGQRYYFDHQRFRVSATSAANGYPAGNVCDLMGDTAWVAGLGERLTLTLDVPDRVDQLAIIPGYTKSKELYFANNRVREVEISVNGGTPFRAGLPDDYVATGPHTPRAYQMVELGERGAKVKTITLKVTQVYPGNRFDDTCISEVMLRKRLPRKPDVRGAR